MMPGTTKADVLLPFLLEIQTTTAHFTFYAIQVDFMSLRFAFMRSSGGFNFQTRRTFLVSEFGMDMQRWEKSQ